MCALSRNNFDCLSVSIYVFEPIQASALEPLPQRTDCILFNQCLTQSSYCCLLPFKGAHIVNSIRIISKAAEGKHSPPSVASFELKTCERFLYITCGFTQTFYCKKTEVINQVSDLLSCVFIFTSSFG